MSIFNSIVGAVDKHPELTQEQHSTLAQTALQMLENRSNLSGLVKNAQAQGLGQTVQSWIGTGANQPVGQQQVAGLLGQDKINELANRVGVPPELASAALSRLLPVIVDKLTPHGQLQPAAYAPSALKI